MSDFPSTVVKADPEHKYVLMVAYSANKMPKRGADQRTDIASPDVLEQACWKFADNGFKVGLNHMDGTVGAARVVENFVHRGPKMRFVGPDGTQQTIRKGDWCVGMILSPKAWEMYKAGLIKGASPQGSAGRKAATSKTLARMRQE
jgi:hypothetical protein